MKQTGFATLTFDAKQKQTRREKFLQQWYALSDPGMEDALYERVDAAVRRAGTRGRRAAG